MRHFPTPTRPWAGFFASSPPRLYLGPTVSFRVDCSATFKKENAFGELFRKTLDSSTEELSEDPDLPFFSRTPRESKDNSDTLLLPVCAPGREASLDNTTELFSHFK